MPSFHEIAVPHKDIYEGKFTLETYAAKLWDVYNDDGPDEYKDPKTFFKRTYETKNIEKIIKSVKDRLDGKGGDHFRPIKTPFGGGKTHTLIYLYHKFQEWYGKKPVVIVGTEIDPKTQTIWGLIEKQLTGKTTKLSGQVSRGATALKDVLKDHQPVLILIDELLHYVVRARGVKVEQSTLAEQTIAFVQELGETVMGLKNACVVVTLPSSANEQLDDEKAAELFEKLKKFSGRIEDSISPINDQDIPSIIRARLFQTEEAQIKDRAESIIADFVAYCEEEGIIPEGIQASDYRKDFEKSYPFLPQVVDVLYKRWGSMLNFQRTRGVLRLLSLVVSNLVNTDKAFISLGDFELTDDRLRGELVRHLDDQFDSVIAKDIVGQESGATKVNKLMPQNLWGKKLGTRAATAIFMYSHSGGAITQGATEAEIKRATVSRGVYSAQISEVLNHFRNQLLYLNIQDGKYLFTKEANILKMKIERMENIKQREIDEAEKQLLKENTGNRFKVIIWPSSPKDVENSHSMKLVILKENDWNLVESIYDTVGESPRVYKNNIFILVPTEGEKNKFLNSLKSKLAWEHISNNKFIPLKDEQKHTLKKELEKENEILKDHIKEYYSTLYIPEKNSPTKNHISVPLATSNTIDQIVYDYLKQESLVTEQLGPILIKTQYLRDNPFVDTNQLYETMLRTPGERRPVSKNVLEDAIKNGVLKGEFGLGELEGEQPISKYFGSKEYPVVSFDPGEIIIQAKLCKQQTQETTLEELQCDKCEYKTTDISDLENHKKTHQIKSKDAITALNYSFSIPEGTVNYTSGMLLNIAEKFKQFRLSVNARDGKMTKQDIENLKETLRQMGTDSDLFDQFNESE